MVHAGQGPRPPPGRGSGREEGTRRPQEEEEGQGSWRRGDRRGAMRDGRDEEVTEELLSKEGQTIERAMH